MPLIDLPLSQLETYAGLNPKPVDHAEYWERALAELGSVDPKVELQRAEFQMERGMVDKVVSRADMREVLASILTTLMMGRSQHLPAA